jgi:Centromere DNA-binding protein complex CBF3 subunit, domain 2/Transcriptional activator of glycolytic enzymes
VRYAYAFRHKDPRQCIVGSIAFYLFLRFDIDRESWPEFNDPDFGWHSIKLLRHRSDPIKRLGYNAQLKAIKETFERFNIQADGFTHSGRKAAVQYGEIIGVEDAQIRQLGHWDSTRMAKHYSSGVARGAARQFAGFPADRGKFYLNRSVLSPSESLRRKIFPRLEESLWFLESLPPEQRDRATGSVLNTLDWFRTVILEDAVILKPQFPESPLFAHALFSDPEFLEYQRNALQAHRDDDIPTAIQIQRLVPEIATELHTITEIMSNQFSFVTKNIDHIQDQVMMIVCNQKSHNNRLMAIERFADRMNRGQIRVISQLQADFDGINANGDADQSLIIASTAQVELLSSPSTSANASASTTMISVSTESTIPKYMVNISITTVDEAFEEWNKGLLNGPDGIRSPSIRQLESDFGTKWRKGDAARQRFIRRKALIQRIERTAANLKLPESDIAHKIELWRKARGMTLDKIQKTLQACKDASEPWGRNDLQLLQFKI